MTTTTARVTRKTAHRGAHVLVTFKDGRTVSGVLDEWGAQILSVRPDAESYANGHTWKRESFWVGSVETVHAAR